MALLQVGVTRAHFLKSVWARACALLSDAALVSDVVVPGDASHAMFTAPDISLLGRVDHFCTTLGGGNFPYASMAWRSDLLVHGHLLPLHSQPQHVNPTGDASSALALCLFLIYSGPELPDHRQARFLVQ